MKILVTACIDVKPERREALLNEAVPFIDAALAEKGCREYAWSIDPRHPGRIRVLEEWDDEACLKAHFESQAYAQMRNHISSAVVEAGSMKYLVAKGEPIYDANGTPHADFHAS